MWIAVRIIVDTDIGLDVDDALALAFLLGSSDVEIELITTVYGDVITKCWRVLEMLHIWGSQNIPVVAGCGEPLLRKRSREWDEREQAVARIVPGGEIAHGHGVVHLIETILTNPGEMTLLCLGPLTNIGMAIRLEPRVLSKLCGLVIMGGVHHLGKKSFQLPMVEYNIGCDPEAAAIVFSSETPITLVTLDVTEKARFDTNHLEVLRKSGNPLSPLLCERVEMWLGLQDTDSTALHDPLAAAVALFPDLVDTTRVKLDVECQVEHAYGQTIATPMAGGNVLVSTEVDSDRFIQLFMATIC
jgi:purine nucleosidase